MPKSLLLIAKTDPLLREIMPAVQDYKDPALAQTIADMCYSLLPEQLKAGAAGMAANQWGIKKRVFLFTPDGSEADKKLEVVINPSYIPYLRPGETEYALIANYEGCFSIPLTFGLINRYVAIVATYYTPAGQKVERQLEGWEARVFQHETDHLDGKLYDGRLDNHAGPECLKRMVFNDSAEMENWLNNLKNSYTTLSDEN